ncbi:hypothetical protein [Nocardioides daeguensis]|uniref:ESX-1 secretion-associated protein n=1 Tax=Nocardioides daeguensis TaxID=908359 RepID=A0ABP6V0T9_9ACTN|nr:hypothetical protein [Nocardioides daeguensis]MBV6727262.1 hypothetical protein [Nocardioides daeguensis]MCR1771276.1 hypothetical protein [Nocardioides daeguensis]
MTLSVAWADLDRLDEEMAGLAGQVAEITAYAGRWVCQRSGFEPSPLCLLRPLAELMDLLADGFDDLRDLAAGDWADLRRAVASTRRDLRAVDAGAVARMPVVAR